MFLNFFFVLQLIYLSTLQIQVQEVAPWPDLEPRLECTAKCCSEDTVSSLLPKANYLICQM